MAQQLQNGPVKEPLGFIGHLYWEYFKPVVFYELGYLFLASLGGQNISFW